MESCSVLKPVKKTEQWNVLQFSFMVRNEWKTFRTFSLTNRTNWRPDTSTTKSEPQSMKIMQHNFYKLKCFVAVH